MKYSLNQAVSMFFSCRPLLTASKTRVREIQHDRDYTVRLRLYVQATVHNTVECPEILGFQQLSAFQFWEPLMLRTGPTYWGPYVSV